MKLWKEYAIEPSLFSNFNLGSEILGGIGIEHGRIVGAVPKKWERRVREYIRAKNRDGDRLRLIERLNGLKNAIMPREIDYDGLRPWIEQVLECHAQHPFDGILADGRHARPEVTDATLGLVGESCWDCERRLEVPRTGVNLANALATVLGRAKVVILVDAYFNPSIALADSKWLRPIAAIASKLRGDGQLARFEVHALSSRHDPWEGGLFSQHCRNNLAAALPGGISIDAMVWKVRPGGPQFHERLIVTDLGGVVVDPGIDDGKEGETYVLRLLDKRESDAYLTKYAPATGPYDLVEWERVSR
jgi:hypothetical protein